MYIAYNNWSYVYILMNYLPITCAYIETTSIKQVM